mmetsp:Transcript_41605/g.67190  ORF Transcript_41605/g.67190 Transcript_41605/m.67190 type:complete len:316 (-) Transcript_41605:87-1034(-)
MMKPLHLSFFVVAIVIAVDSNRCTALLALGRRGIKDAFVLHGISPRFGVVVLEAVEGLPHAHDSLGHGISPSVVGPHDEVVELHHLRIVACAGFLDPLHADLLSAEVLGVLKGVPIPDERLARRVFAVVARRVGANALVNGPKVILHPHGLVDHEDGSRDVWRTGESSCELHVVVRASGLFGDVVILGIGVLAAVAERLDGVVLREESKAKWVGFPADEGVRVTSLLPILPLHCESLWVKWGVDSRHVHLVCGGDGRARGELDFFVLVTIGFPTDALAQLASGHLILITTALAIPALGVAVVRAVELRVKRIGGG